VLWKVPLSDGLSSFSVEKGRLFTMGERRVASGMREFCLALNAETGAELWAAEIGLADYPNGGVGSDDGPRSTPTVDGDRVYVFGAYMDLVCLNAANGAEIWRRDLEGEFGSRRIPWQNAASPTLIGDLVFVNSNGRTNEHLIAFNKNYGTVVWKRGSYGMTHATPVQGLIGGVEQVIFLGQTALVSVAPMTGQVLWEFPLFYNYTSVAASPVVANDTVYISRAYAGSLAMPQAGALVLQISSANGRLSPARKWERVNALLNHWATPVYFEGHYYGIYGQDVLSLRCIDAENGTVKWQLNDFGYGSVTLAQDKLLVLGDDGELALVDTNPDEYSELARIRPLTGKCWNNPALSDGRIYIRSTREAVALDVSLPNSGPGPELKLAIARGVTGQFVVEVATANGTPIEPARASKISFYGNIDPGHAAGWERLGNSSVLANGRLTLELPAPDGPRLFFRTEELP
jgi:outer membrane protein assembly factor BamB